MDEPGAQEVQPLLRGALVSAVNWSEILQKVEAKGKDPSAIGKFLEAAGVSVIASTKADAVLAARFWEPGTAMSLADRFCLALAYRLNVPAVSADRAWESVDVGTQIIVIR